MKLFPAIDLYGGQAVRLRRGDYNEMTVYERVPLDAARRFAGAGASYLHVVDLEGARDGGTPNLAVIRELAARSGLQVEVGGGIRSEDVVRTYLDAGAFRVILGTAAVTQPGFAAEMAAKYGAAVAVGVDLKDGRPAIRGWTETADVDGMAFCRRLAADGVRTVIVTDISRDGLLGGSNVALYRRMAAELPLELIASGGVTTLEDVAALRDLGLAGAILGRALYTGDLDLRRALELTGEVAP